MPDLLTQGDIERSIMAVADELEEETERYDRVANLAADREASYKHAAAKAFVALADSGVKMTAGERQARADLAVVDEYRTWKITEAARASSREALLSLRARLDALRTLSANVRHQT